MPRPHAARLLEHLLHPPAPAAAAPLRPLRKAQRRRAAGERLVGHDLAADPTPDRLQALLRDRLYGSDLGTVDGDRFVGLPEPADTTPDNRGLSGQRGFHYPQVPARDTAVAVGSA
ncbi:hypothetical protein [Salipiger thiooxidans]|uniref:hypothetical protein n=1 Tax=Salipiger thiooxidans TaxID=282683 RepID=UPI001CD741A7|nr:hypothetical protein [Salipiger thiooxidans]MCA0847969.1 hypothetical protein [Salipiger thiooxidans]